MYPGTSTMIQIKFLHLCFLVAVIAVMQSAVCSFSFGPSLPNDTVFEFIPSSPATTMLAIDEERYVTGIEKVEECKQIAISKGAQYFYIDRRKCYCGTLLHPICRTPSGFFFKLYVVQNFVTDGSPNDGAYLRPSLTINFVGAIPHRGFRVETPTIVQIPGYAEEKHFLERNQGKLVIYTKDEKKLETDGNYLIDPACYTNSSCGIPMMNSAIEVVSLDHVILHNVCGQIIDIESEPGINVFSHEGIGCKFFPDDYPVSNCEVTISGSDTLKVNATLLNFRETACNGSELLVYAPSIPGTLNPVDVCTENAPTEFTAAAGIVRISFSAGAGQTGQTYGFIITITK